MGIFSSRYRFHLNNSDWWVRVAVTSAGLSYKVKINGQLLLDERREQSSEEILTPQSLHVSHGQKDYRLEIGPVSAWGYGVHVYEENRLVHRYKNRDFVTLTRHEKVFGKFDKFDAWLEKKDLKDTRPFWKTITEALIIGGSVGAIYALSANWIEAVAGISLDKFDIWPAIIVALLIIFLLPPKLRLIK